MEDRFIFTSKVKSSSHMTTSLFIFLYIFFLMLQSGGGNGNRGLSSVEATTTTGAPAHTGLQFQDLVGLMNVNPTHQYLLLYSESGVAIYNKLYPSYYVPSSSYKGVDQDWHHFQSPPLVSFEIFSDKSK